MKSYRKFRKVLNWFGVGLGMSSRQASKTRDYLISFMDDAHSTLTIRIS